MGSWWICHIHYAANSQNRPVFFYTLLNLRFSSPYPFFDLVLFSNFSLSQSILHSPSLIHPLLIFLSVSIHLLFSSLYQSSFISILLFPSLIQSSLSMSIPPFTILYLDLSFLLYPSFCHLSSLLPPPLSLFSHPLPSLLFPSLSFSSPYPVSII